MRRPQRIGGLAATAAAALFLSAPVQAQEPRPAVDAPFPKGQIVEEVRTEADPSQRYAGYLPTSFDPNRRWPVVILMDARGRALVPLRRLVPAAERLGYVLASSYNTLSDGPAEPNVEAAAALLAEGGTRLSADTARFYLVGFSGTARIAWALAYKHRPRVAGVVGFGAGPPSELGLEQAQQQVGNPFAFFGGAGEADYNHPELVLLEGRLPRLGMRHRIEYYPGPHAWPPENVFDQALEWLHLQAMRQGLLPADASWIGDRYEEGLAEARTHEAEGRLSEAWNAYRWLARDFEGLLDTADAAAGAAALVRAPEVSGWLTRRDRLARTHLTHVREASEYLADSRVGSPRPLELAVAALRVDSLKAAAADTMDAQGAAAARRVLADLFTLTSFYEARYQIESGDWARAVSALEIADTILPNRAWVCRWLAQALAELKRTDEALSRVRCFVDAGSPKREELERDPAFERLREEEEFRKLVGALE